MAKRGRKKANKVTSLSTADKGHLSRILKKVRQIKQNKARLAPASAGNAALIARLVTQLQTAQNAYNSFIGRGLNLSLPTNQNTLNLLAQRVNAAQQALATAQGLGQTAQ